MNRAKLREELIRDEGLRLDAYKDTVGLWTIGVGHLLGSSMRMEKITRSEAMALLESDIEDAVAIVKLAAPWLLVNEDARSRVLTNMAFNLGSRLVGFKKFLVSVNDHNWSQAATEMMQSKWATQVGDRAVRLRDMMLEGDTDR